ncbi:hypothetical protein CFP56_043461 [Quercus suber]|uniref:Storage protein n=1 Tax=Quercus suber TaxID=58331 RepID=A0AAW0LKG4_QUESU
MGNLHRRKPNDRARQIVTTIIGIVIGFFIGISIPSASLNKINIPSNIITSLDVAITDIHGSTSTPPKTESLENVGSTTVPKIHVPTNPRGAESLPPGIVVPETDLYLRRLWGDPNEDLQKKPKYLVTFTVGIDQRNNIDAAVKKFSEDFMIMLFHYDGHTSEWDQFEWSKRAIHISVVCKKVLHPNVVSAFEYIFIWDEDLGVEHFNGDKYIELVKKHGLEISQPGLEPNNGLTWEMTKRRGDREVHMDTEEKPGWCNDPHLPPCAAFVEIMAQYFLKKLGDNDLVHGWGLDFALRRCVEPAHEKIGVVDSQWIVHQVIPSLGSQGQSEDGKAPWEGVRARCKNEWAEFQSRLTNADKAYLAQFGKE